MSEATVSAGVAPVGFQVGAEVLGAALAYLAGGVPSRPSVPILAGVVLTAHPNGTVTAHTFDYEQTRIAELKGATVQSYGRVLVGAKLLSDMVGKLPKGRKGTGRTAGVAAPTAVFHGTGTKLVLTAGATRFTLATMPIEDYPELPAMPPTVGVIDGKRLAAGVAQVAPTAGKDATLPILTGLHVNLTASGGLTVDATDRYRLGSFDSIYTPDGASGDLAALVPAKTLIAVCKMFGKTGGDVWIGADVKPNEYTDSKGKKSTAGTSGTLSLRWGPYTLVTRLLEGDFPKIRALYPITYAHTATVDAGKLAEVVDRVSVALDRATPVRLTFTDEKITVRGGSEADGSDGAATEAMPATWTGEGRFTIGFNHSYLIDALKAVGTDHVQFGFTDNKKPGVLHPLDADKDIMPGYRHLIMPVRVGGDTDKAAEEAPAPEVAEAPAEAVAAAAELDAKRAADLAAADAKTKPARRAPAKAKAPAKAEPETPAVEAEPVQVEPKGSDSFEWKGSDSPEWQRRAAEYAAMVDGPAGGSGRTITVVDKPTVEIVRPVDALRSLVGAITGTEPEPGKVAVQVDAGPSADELAAEAARWERHPLRPEGDGLPEVTDAPDNVEYADAVGDTHTIDMPEVTTAPDGGLVWGEFTTTERKKGEAAVPLKPIAVEMRNAMYHVVTLPELNGSGSDDKTVANRLRVSVYRDNSKRTLTVTAYLPGSGREVADLGRWRRLAVSTALNVRGVTALL